MDYNKAVDYVIAKEGVFSKDPKDSGNWTGGAPGVGIMKGTKFGISAKAYPHLDIINLTRDQAKEIYYRDYWLEVWADRIPEGIRLPLFDHAVNRGPKNAILALQAAAGVRQDGSVGPITLKAAERVTPWKYAEERIEQYVDLVQRRPKDFYNLKGWLWRVLRITEIALREG